MNKLLEMAKTQIGVQETPRGSNWGPMVQQYLHSVGIAFPASWCMAFVYWCAEQAGIKVNVGNPGQSILMNPLVHTGGVLKQWHEINPKFKFNIPQIGDIFIMDLGHGLGHTGIIEDIHGEILDTIEGNTNDTGSREGYEVCRRTRRLDPDSKIIGYIRI
jgi:hypothetical protein